MIKIMKPLVFLFAFTLSNIAMCFTLMEAEKIAIDKSYKLKGFSAEKSSLVYQKYGITSSLMPKLSAGYEVGKQINPNQNYFQNPLIEVRADFSNPFSFFAKRRLIDTKKKFVDLNLANHKHKILHQIRLDYFKAKLFQEQIEQAKRYLNTVEKVALISENKYLQGLIQVSAKNRTMLAKIKQRQSITSLRELYPCFRKSF